MRALFAASLAGLALACAAPPMVPTPAPDFELQDVSGKTVRLSDFRGHPVLVDFWATWCQPCRESIPVYAKLYAKRRGSGFSVIGIDGDEPVDVIATFAAKYSVPYPLVRDPKRAAYDAFGVRGLPTAFLIDADGRIVRRWDAFNEGTLYEVDRELAALPQGK